MRALYPKNTSPKNTSAPSTLQSGVLSPPTSPLYRNAWSPVNYLLNRFRSSSIYTPSPFPEVLTSLTAPKHALWSSSTSLIVPCIFISFLQTILECWSPGSCLLLFIFQPHSLPASLVPGTILGIEKSHAFHLLLCIITADSNFIISIPTQYTHLFPKFFIFYFLAADWAAPLGCLSYPKLKMFKTEPIIPSSTASFTINVVLTYPLFSPFPILQFYILNISQMCSLNFSPNTMYTFIQVTS